MTFDDNCSPVLTAAKYSAVAGGHGFKFTTPLNTPAMQPRNTYYALDGDGVVVGFATRLIDPDHPYRQTTLIGYAVTQTVQFIAEVNKDGLPVCLYSLTNNNAAL
jgi:hypothetical protein